MDLIFVGPPGSGKGTQAKILEKEFRQISTGDLLREHRAQGTELGKKAQSYLDRGDLVPDEVVIQIVKEELGKGGDMLFDGFPRTKSQAAALTALFSELGREQPAVFIFRVDEDEVIKRLQARQRADDRPETIKNRLAVYRRETEPLIDFFKGTLRGNVHEIPAHLSVDDVAKSIGASLRSAKQIHQ